MLTIERRVYKLRTEEALDCCKNVVYPRHRRLMSCARGRS
jgi:hypothetical protein